MAAAEAAAIPSISRREILLKSFFMSRPHAGFMPAGMFLFDTYPQKKNNHRSSSKRNLSNIVVLFTFPFKHPEGNARYFRKRFQL
jgi:hypothetical protein